MMIEWGQAYSRDEVLAKITLMPEDETGEMTDADPEADQDDPDAWRDVCDDE